MFVCKEKYLMEGKLYCPKTGIQTGWDDLHYSSGRLD